MLIISQLWIYLLLSAANLGIIKCSKVVRTVRRGSGSDSQCMSSLIKSREEFPDSAFSASSSLEDRIEFQPYQARLTEVYGSKEHTSGHAWCPSTPIEESLREWIQAEFTDLVMIGAIFTAGRGDGNVKEFMPNFVLKYQREDNGPWFEHVKRDGTRVLKANSDPRNLARATLDSMVIAKRIRIYPYNRDGKQQVCLRFALFGCKFPDGVVSYSMPQGGDRSYSTNPTTLGNSIGSSSANFRDLSYDGQLIGTNDHLTDGMGQLMDNVAYLGNVTNPLALHPSQPGFHFVGWYQHGQTDVPIIFKFDTTRAFTWVRLFTFDSIQLRARLFSRVVVAFSLDGQTYNHSVEVFTGRAQLFDPRTAAFSRTRRAGDNVDRFAKHNWGTQPQGDPLIYVDQDWDGALVLEADLGGRIGRFVRLSLTATDGWILLSEVQFNSSIVKSTMNPSANTPSGSLVPGTELRAPIETSTGDLSLPGVVDSGQIHGSVDAGNRPPSVSGKSAADLFDGDSTSVTDGMASLSSARDSNEADALQLSSRSPFTSPFPFIIAIAVLLFLLSTVVLIWLCTRQHQKRSQLRLHGKGLLCSDSTKLNFNPTAVTGVGSSYHPSELMNVPGVFGGGNGSQEATKLLSSPPYPGLATNLRVDGLTNAAPTSPGQGAPLTNGVHPSAHLNEPSTVLNGPINLGLSYPGRPGPGVILPCSPSSSCSSHTSVVDPMTTVGCALTAVSTIASPMQQPPNSTMEMSNIYAGTDMSCMIGSSTAGHVPIGYVPAFIALPTDASAGCFVLQPIHLSQPGPLSPAPLGTPDSGSLYTSIRLSATQTPLVKSSATSMGQSENEMTSPRLRRPRIRPIDRDGACGRGVSCDGNVDGGEDTDDDVMDLHEDVASDGAEPEVVNKQPITNQDGEETQSSARNTGVFDLNPDTESSCIFNATERNARHSGDGQTQSEEVAEVRTSVTSTQLPRPSGSSYVPQSARRTSNQRSSGYSLPDGEESQASTNAFVLSSGSSVEGVTLYVVHRTPSGFVLQPRGPEYASASLFGFTPPPSEPPCSTAPPTCTESMPATHYRPSVPNYTVSFARPGQALVSAAGAVYAGPASFPVTATTLRRPSAGQHTNSNTAHRFQPTQTAGVLFLPHSALTSPHAEDAATANSLYQATVNGFPAGDYGASYNIYQPVRSGPVEELMQQRADGQSASLNAPQETWIFSAHPDDLGARAVGSNALFNPGQIQLVSTSGLMDCSHPHSANVSPQHYYPAQLIFPSVPPLSNRPVMDPVMRTGVPLEHQTFTRGSPIGANASASSSAMAAANLPGSYGQQTSETSNRDGASSNRLPIYSLCP